MIKHRIEHDVTFGECDPVGIVFYPNFYAWFDRTFHDWLRPFGGHAGICDQLGVLGVGLMEAQARFLRPVRDGDRLTLTLSVERWGTRALHLAYEGHVNGVRVLEGQEVRGLFRATETGMVAAELSELRKILGIGDE